MPIPALLDIIGLALLVVIVVHAAFLHMRLSHLRRALDEAGQVLPSLDAAVAHMDDAAGGFARRVKTDLEGIDIRIANAKRIASELSLASRAADELATQLDRQLRQTRRLESARAGAIPPQLAEPKGFAERLGAAAPANTASSEYPHLNGPPFPAPRPDRVAETRETLVRVNMI